MNGFQKRSILPWKRSAKKWLQSHMVLSIIILILAALGIKGCVGAINLGNPFSVKQIVISAVSEAIDTDSDGHTNILLLGVGGEGHDGGTLTDTMIVASVDYKNNLVPMLSIPRDIYVENDLVGWGTRINSIYEYVAENNEEDYELGMQELLKEIENIVGIELHYYAKIDFQGFVDIVDAVGGIEITLEENFYDSYYPAAPGSGYLYETFLLPAGTQEIDGDTALKYVRSRFTTSDFDRAHRQQEVISAIKDRALSVGFLINPIRIKNTLSAISDNFETNLSISEMLNFASLATNFGGDTIIAEVLSDDIWATGGFLYPPDRELYGGAFVLVPYTEDFSEIHTFADILFHHPEALADKVSIQILNGTGVEGLAGMNYYHLTRYGFNIVDTENSLNEDFAFTRIFPAGDLNAVTEETIDALTEIIPGYKVTETPEEYDQLVWDTDAEVIIELGADFHDYYKENEDLFYYEFLY
jgi:LCP family protein required for cell wall assembly